MTANSLTPLDRLRRAGLVDGPHAPTDVGEHPASDAEQAIWLQSQIRPEVPAYHVAIAMRSDTPLDRAALERSWRAMHGTVTGLRTSFHERGGSVFARVAGWVENEPLRDLGTLGDDPHDALREVARVPFDLTRAPLARLAIGRDSQGADVLLFVTHHIVADAHATNALLARLHATARGEEPAVPTFGRTVTAANPDHLEWWAEQLGAAVPPATITRRADASARHDGTVIVAGRGGRIRVWSAEDSPEPNTSDAAAIEITALRHAIAETFGERDVLVGLISSARRGNDQSFTNRTNILPLRRPLRPGPVSADSVGEEQRVVLDALEHRDAPFEAVRQRVSAARVPIDVVYSRFGSTVSAADGISILDLDLGTAKFGITLQSQSLDGGGVAYLEYSDEVLTPAEARALGDRFATIVAELRRVRGVGSVAPSATTHATGPAVTGDDLAERFERWAAVQPDAVAAATDDQAMTYGELNARAERLAAQINNHDSSRAPVGVLIEPGIDLIVAVLAMAKTGRAIMPFDPEHPIERIVHLAGRAGVSLWVTASRHRHRLHHTATIIPVSGDAPTSDGTHDISRPRVSHPGAPAYLIATSGSTGEPKIVQVSHANVMGLLDGARKRYDIGAADCWSFVHSIAFDFSVWEIWGPLTTGGRIAIASRHEARDPSALIRFLHRHEVNVLSQTPSAFVALTAVFTTFDAPIPASLRWVTLGGELFRLGAIERWRKISGAERVRVVNMYGITETTVHVTFRELGDDGQGPADSPIGTALPGMAATVLDDDLRPSASGEPGEIFVTGAGVANGYLGDPRRTALAYVPDPDGDGTRGYRTGDRAVVRDGELIALGRADAQVKIRGHRIELGEVEATLLAHPSVQQAHVAPRPNGSGLSAFITLASGADADDLRDWLKGRLPEYMVPTVHVVEAISRTPNGKVDADALFRLARESDVPAANAMPLTDIERRVCAIWATVLDVDAVSPLDSFFGRGGDSLLAVTTVSRMRDVGMAATVADIYEHQTVRDVIRVAVSRSGEGESEAARTDSEDSWPMSLLQQGMVFHQETAGDYVNLTTTLVGGRLDPVLLKRAVKIVFDRHEVLRTRFDLDAPEGPRQVIDPDCDTTVTMLDWSDVPRPQAEQRLSAWRDEERARGIDIGAAPLLRFTAQLLSESEFWLSATECHALLDGWSFTSTVAEIVDVYADLLEGATPSIAPPEGRFADNVVAERRALDTPEQAARLGAIVESSTPLDLPHSGVPMKDGVQDRLIELFSADLIRRTDEFVTAHGMTLKSTLLAATSIAIARYTGQQRYLLGVVVNSRPEATGADDIRGMYLNTLPYAVDVQDRSATLLELVRASFAAERELMRLRSFPGVELVRRFGADAEPSALFNYTRFHALRRTRDRAATIRGSFEEDAPTSYPLYVSFDHSGDPERPYLALLLTARPEYFTGEQVRLLSALIVEILTEIVDSPERRVHAAGIAHTGATSGAAAPRTEKDVVTRVREHVKEQPGELVVVDGGTTTTRREFDSRRRAIAAGLRKRGVAPGDRIGVHLPRGLDHLAATFAIWSVGAVYVPIDPDTPPGRRDLMMWASRLALSIVADPSDGLDGDTPDALAFSAYAGESRHVAIVTPSPTTPAYVMFTSGSTGRPKGVVVTHGNLANAANTIGGRISVSDRVLWSTTPSFDISLVESVLTLASGACVHVAPTGAFDPDAIASVLESGDITIAQGTPTWWEEIVRTGARLGSIDAWVGGEALPGRLVESLSETRSLYNWYGPTECTIWSSVRDARGDAGHDPAPIGDSLPTERFELVVAGDPVRDGCAGELIIGGAGVASGYLDDPRLTARMFVPDQVGPPGSRRYRTGDRARRGADGGMEFLGRLLGSLQVKYRGNRIDLREVEAAVRACEGISSAMAMIVAGRLVAFCVTGTDDRVDPHDVQRDAARVLSRSVVPRVILVDALPRLPNGKVDPNALRLLAEEAMSSAGPLAAGDDGSLGSEIVGVWAAVLGLPEVDSSMSFIDLGGDSISALRVSARLRARGWDLSPGAVLTSAGASDLARILTSQHDDGA